MAESKQKPRSILFTSTEALAQYQRIKDLCHERGLFAWEVVRDALDSDDFIKKSFGKFALKLSTGIVEMQINTAKKVKEGLVNPDHIDPDFLADDWAMWIEQQFEEFIKQTPIADGTN